MGFQTYIANMDIFKSLPFGRWQIAAGQLAGPLILLVSLQYFCIVVFVWWSLDQYQLWLVTAAFAPLVSLTILGVVNAVSLLYPRQPDDGVVRELESVGYILVFVCLMLAGGVAIMAAMLGAGTLVWFLTHSVPAIVIACWLVMLIAGFAGVWLTGWAFGRFDVAKHRL